MTKSKSQLRAEAVERLRNYNKRKHKNLARCVLSDRYEDVSFEANRLMLMSVNGKEADSLQDSRELLEADIKKYRWEHGETSGRVTEWLDRQVAITKDEILGTSYRYARALANGAEDMEIMDELCELRSKVDALESENEKLNSKMQYKNRRIAEPQAKVDVLDSREKLEEDIKSTQWCISLKDILAWLDRQAAITERHWMEICGANANANVELNRQNEELRLKVRRQGKQLAKVQDAIRKRNDGVLKNSWKKQIDELKAERDMYRDKLGRAIDAAHGIIRLKED